MLWLTKRRGLLWILFLTLSFLSISPAAFGQKFTFGVLAGVSLSDDFRPTTRTFLGGTTQHVSNASQWFMVGPVLELALPGQVSVEIDAIRRRIRSTTLTVLAEPIEFPGGITISSLGPFTAEGFTWQFSLLGKYRIDAPRVKPFVELGPSFLPQENRDQTGITAGSGVEIPLWRLSVAPTLRYTRWVNNDNLGGVRNQFQFLVGVHETSTSVRPRAFGRQLSLGGVAGLGLTNLLRDRFEPAFLSSSVSDSDTAMAGIMIELPLRERLSVEVDGLYRPEHLIDRAHLPDGSIQNGTRTAFITWQFPLLAKYRMSGSRVAPIIELGPSFRAIAHANAENYSHYGITGGMGAATRVEGLRIAPAIRYTRWAADKRRFGQEPFPGTRLNQLELVVGFSF